uniref:BPI2 domain-containing protein n=1 Tax=Schistocephalus solidus TaxID=70667 RepID=A0A183SBS8_SCHSO
LPVDCLARVGFNIRLADTVDPSAILNFKDLIFPSFSFVSSPEMEVCLRLGFYLPADNFAFNPALTESIYPASFVISRKEGQVLSLNLSMLFPVKAVRTGETGRSKVPAINRLINCSPAGAQSSATLSRTAGHQWQHSCLCTKTRPETWRR